MKESTENSPQQVTQSSCAGGAFTVSAKKKKQNNNNKKKRFTTCLWGRKPFCLGVLVARIFREQSGHVNISFGFLSTSQSGALTGYLSKMLQAHSLCWMNVFCLLSLQVPPYCTCRRHLSQETVYARKPTCLRSIGSRGG